MKVWKCLILTALIVGGCVTLHQSDEGILKTNSVEKSSLEPYIPPDPVAPATYHESLGFVTLDKSDAYTVHALAADRDTLYDMFPPEARFYALNVTQLWFWGDGSSDTGASFTHVYPGAGTYSLTVYHDVNFRGGQTKRITSQVVLNIPEPLEPAILSVTPPPDIVGNPTMDPASHPMSITNAGGRMVHVEPFVEKLEGTIDDLSWISFDPPSFVVQNDGEPVSFNMILDWPNAPEGTIKVSIHLKQSVYTQGWHIPWKAP